MFGLDPLSGAPERASAMMRSFQRWRSRTSLAATGTAEPVEEGHPSFWNLGGELTVYDRSLCEIGAHISTGETDHRPM